MTLVYGGADEDIGFLVGDTLISFDAVRDGSAGNFDANNHTLKIQILNASTAVAFAGVVEAALAIINKLSSEIKANPNINVPDKLYQLHKNHVTKIADPRLTDCEFLVLQIMGGARKLAKVTEHEWKYYERAYIGDAVEYTKLMQLRHPYQAPTTRLVQQSDGSFREEPLVMSKGQIDFSEVSDAMEQLTHQLKSETVGAVCGCVTRVVDAWPSGDLEYLQSIESGVSAEEGVTGYTYLSSNSEIRGVGIYYRSGKMGFLFIVGDTEPNQKEYADTLTQFIDIAQKKYGLNLVGGTWSE